MEGKYQVQWRDSGNKTVSSADTFSSSHFCGWKWSGVPFWQQSFLCFGCSYVFRYIYKTCIYCLQRGILLRCQLFCLLVSNLWQFNSTSMQSSSALTLSSKTKRPLSIAILANGESILTWISVEMTALAIPLPDSIMGENLFMPSSSNRETGLHVSELFHNCATREYHLNHPLRFSWPRCFCNSRSEGPIYATPESRMQSARSMKMKTNRYDWSRGNIGLLLFVKSIKPESMDQTVAFKIILLSQTAIKCLWFELPYKVYTVVYCPSGDCEHCEH